MNDCPRNWKYGFVEDLYGARIDFYYTQESLKV